MINFDAAACLFEIRVNDVPVITLELDGQASTRIPINFAISKSGEQKVSAKILPKSGELELSSKAQLNYTIELYDVYNDVFVFISDFRGNMSPKIDKEKKTSILTSSTVFEAKIPYQLRDYWKDGENLKDVDDLEVKLRNTYLNLGKIISEENYDLFSQKMADREYNMATAMYLSNKKANTRIQKLINDFKTGYNVMMFEEDSVVVFSAYGKKAALKTLNGHPALSFGNEEEQEKIMLDIEFYFNKKNNAFEII